MRASVLYRIHEVSTMEDSGRTERLERVICMASNHSTCTVRECYDSCVCSSLDLSSCHQKTNATVILDQSSQAIHHSLNHLHTTVDREVDGYCHVGGDTVQCQKFVPLLQELCLCGVVGWALGLGYQGIVLHEGNLCLLVMNHEEEDDAEEQEEEEANPSHTPNTEAGTDPQENSDVINMVNAHVFPEQGRRSECRPSVDVLFEAGIFAVPEVQPLEHPSAVGRDKPQLTLVTCSSFHQTIKTISVFRQSYFVAAESSYVSTEYSERQTNAELCKEDVQVSSNISVVFSEDQNLSICQPVSSLVVVLSRVLSLVYVSFLVNVLLTEEDEHGDDLVQDGSNPSGVDGQNVCSVPLGSTNENCVVPQCVSEIKQAKQGNPPRRKDGETLVKLSGRSDDKLQANCLRVKDEEVQADLPSTQDEEIQVHLFSAKDEGIQVNLSSTKDGEGRVDLLSTKKEGIQDNLPSTQEEEEQRNVLITEEDETQEKVQVREDEDINLLRLTSPDISVNLCEDPVEIMEEKRAELALEDNRHGHHKKYAARNHSTRRLECSQHECSEVRTENGTEHVPLCQTHNTAVKSHTTEALHENPPVDCCDQETRNEFSKDNQEVTALSSEEMNGASLNWALNIDTGTDDDHTAKKMKQDDPNMIHPSHDADCRNSDFKNTKSKNTDCKDIESKNTDCKLTVSDNRPNEWFAVDFNKSGDPEIPDSRKRAAENPTWDKIQYDVSISEDIDKDTIKTFFKELNAKSSKHQTNDKAETLKESKEEDAILSTFCSTDHISPPFRKWVVSMLRTSQRGTGAFQNEWNRLATFSNIRVPPGIYIIPLANNGFFVPDTSERGTQVECAFCGVRVPLMQFRGRRVEEVHRQVSPSCRFVSGTTGDNVSIQDSVRGVEVPLSLDNRSSPPQGSVPGVFPSSSLLPADREELQTDDSSEPWHLAPPTAVAEAVRSLPLRDASSMTAAANSRSMSDDATIVSAAQTPDISNPQIDDATPTCPPSNLPSISASASVAASASIDSSTTVTNTPSAAAPTSATTSTSIAISTSATASVTTSATTTTTTDTLSAAATTTIAPISTTSVPNAAAEILNTPGEERNQNAEETIPTEPPGRGTLPSSSVPGTAAVAAGVADAGARSDGAVTASESPEAGSGQVAAAAESASSARGEGGGSADAGEGEASSSSTTANGEQRQTVTYEDLGIFAQRPKRSDMAVTQVRIQTFANWPYEETHPAVRMAEAGFYYTGHADLVRCFYCKGGLKTWERSDQPWVEHCRWFPRCPYVRLVKGQRFVDIVQRLNNNSSISSSNSGDSGSQQSNICEEQVTEEVQKLEEEESRNLLRVTAQREGGDLPAPSAVDPFEQVLAQEGLRPDVDITEDNLEELSERLEDEQDVIRSLTLCKVCQTEEVNVLFLPCGHLVACAQCSPALRTCAICRQTVKGSVRVRMPDDTTDVTTGGHDTRPEGAEPGDTTGTSARP